MLDELRGSVCAANRRLATAGLARSPGATPAASIASSGLVVIKPSGVRYEELGPESMVVVDLEGRLIEGKLKPSSDTPTHLVLYRAFPAIGGVVHTHSRHATMFAQAQRRSPAWARRTPTTSTVPCPSRGR